MGALNYSGNPINCAKLAIAALVLCLAAGCQTTKSGSFCQIAQPIRLSPSQIDALTDDQVRDLLAHNRKGAALCGWKP